MQNNKINKINKKLFGVMPDGREIFNYELFDDKGQSVVISEYACAIIKINVYNSNNRNKDDKDDKKELIDVALGYDTLDEYINDKRCFGAIVGRYANRIKDGRFNLNGVTYELSKNKGNNTLHGGFKGFNKQVFKSEIQDNKIIFKYTSPDGEEGFPGNFVITETASFVDGTLRMIFNYESDKDTPASITNHCYFNLNGKGDILNHEVMINAEKFCMADDTLVAVAPTVSVQDTPFDFRTLKSINRDIKNTDGGYDNCFELNKNSNKNNKNFAARAYSSDSGINLEVYSDMPAVQFYTGNTIGSVKGKYGNNYNNFSGFALECQQFPNAVNEPRFPNAVIKAGERKSCFIEYKFF